MTSTETSGTSDLYWGTIHLYRELGAEGESGEKDKRTAMDEDDGTIVGMISVPGNLTAAALLAYISPALGSVAQLRMLRSVFLCFGTVPRKTVTEFGSGV